MSRPRSLVVGAGIVGLAHAWRLALQGHEVVVCEREAGVWGASVRNFGLGLIVGQAQGDTLDLAWRTRAHWLEVLPRLGVWHEALGSLTVARDGAEWEVLQAFQSLLGGVYGTELRTPAAFGPTVAQGVGALYSPHEIQLESRVVVPRLAQWLQEMHGVQFAWETQVLGIDLPEVHTSRGRFEADQVWVCAGHEFRSLYPEAFAELGVSLCRLQMLRLAAPDLPPGPTLLTGLSALHYPSFAQDPTLAGVCEGLRRHVAAREPEVQRHGLHLIVQPIGSSGELIVGDSHHYGASVSPFQSEAVDRFLIQQSERLLGRQLPVVERWQGVYASGPRPYEVLKPAPGVTAVAITSGIGMSIAFALAERHCG